MADVAALAGMSPTAVSLVLNDRPGSRLSPEAVQRIKEAAAELNYRPNPAARSLRLGKTQTVGFISDDVTVTRYASAMIRGLLDVADEFAHTVLITETGADPARIENAIETVLDRRPDGLIFGQQMAREITLPEIPANVPVVLINSSSTDHRPCVLPAEFEAGYAIAKLLTDAGHRRVGLIGYDEGLRYEPAKSATVGERYAGIFKALDEAGAEVVATYRCADWEPPHGLTAINQFFDEGAEFTALICLNDRLSFGVYQGLQDRGLRVPDDISVVSFDDEEITQHLRPGLTTAAIPYLEMGRQAMRMVLGKERPTGTHLVPMPLKVRGSVREV